MFFFFIRSREFDGVLWAPCNDNILRDVILSSIDTKLQMSCGISFGADYIIIV